MVKSDAQKIVAVYGNSGSYKTATAIEIAKSILEYENNADVMVVSVDATKPLVPILIPNGKKQSGSLGALLAKETLDQNAIMAETVVANNKIGILAYNAGENYQTYAAPTESRIDDLYMTLRHLVNYTIIDCTSDICGNLLTARALANADVIVELVSCGLQGLAFHFSQDSILQGYQYSNAEWIRAVTISGRFKQDSAAVTQQLTKVAGEIPFSQKLATAWECGEAMDKIGDKAHSQVIDHIAGLLIEIDENGTNYDAEDEYEED